MEHPDTDPVADELTADNMTMTPEQSAELVERLRAHMGKQDTGILLADCRKAADLIDDLIESLTSKAGTDELVGHVAAILEEWDMKDAPNECTGHNYNDIARDIVSRSYLFAETAKNSEPTAPAGVKGSDLADELEREMQMVGGDVNRCCIPEGLCQRILAALRTSPPTDELVEAAQKIIEFQFRYVSEQALATLEPLIRAQVVAWLRNEAERYQDEALKHRRPRGGFSTLENLASTRAGGLTNAANAIQRGEHEGSTTAIRSLTNKDTV